MKTGTQATHVISWAQTEVDGLRAASLDVLTPGSSWRWTGHAVRVDGPQGVLRLEGATGAAEIRLRAARMVRRLVGKAIGATAPQANRDAALADDQGFVVTDGRNSYNLTLIPVPDSGTRLLMVVGNLPPSGQDLWVVRTAIDQTPAPTARSTGGVICFAPGTRIATPDGLRAIQDLRQGDLINTRDNGPQPVMWSGHRRMSGARLYAMPHLRPIRFRTGALGIDRPDQDLVVSPQHRMLIKGAAARALFNASEVLVMAEDLLNDSTITIDHSMREVTYVHVMLDAHNIVWANGLETESFHPANTGLEMLDPTQRQVLLNLRPEIAQDPHRYGDYARRNLSGPEAAILRHEMAH